MHQGAGLLQRSPNLVCTVDLTGQKLVRGIRLAQRYHRWVVHAPLTERYHEVPATGEIAMSGATRWSQVAHTELRLAHSSIAGIKRVRASRHIRGGDVERRGVEAFVIAEDA